jgi:hypothetical protein
MVDGGGVVLGAREQSLEQRRRHRAILPRFLQRLADVGHHLLLFQLAGGHPARTAERRLEREGPQKPPRGSV